MGHCRLVPPPLLLGPLGSVPTTRPLRIVNQLLRNRYEYTFRSPCAGPSLHEGSVDHRSRGGGDVRPVGWPGLSFRTGPSLAVHWRIPAGPPTALSFAGLSLVALLRA